MHQSDAYYAASTDVGDSCIPRMSFKRSLLKDEVSSEEDDSPRAKKAHLGDDGSIESQVSEGTSADDSEPEYKPMFQNLPSSFEKDDAPSFQNHTAVRELKRKGSPVSHVKFDNKKIFNMMSKMNWEGKGLGKDEQGRQDPVEASKQKGRRGLGFENKELQEANRHFDPDDEIIEVEEKIEWLTNLHHDIPEYEELQSWMSLGHCKKTIDDETNFCDPKVVENIVNSKNIFDELDKNEMRDARTRSNPFETIRGAFFLNRAAVKMANIDRACDFMFTQPQLHHDELLYFADVCAGPGGFSEYVLWRKKWHAKGFGFTLKRMNDFKLEDFHSGSCETFHPYYGPSNNIDEQGDVFLPKNQEALKNLIMEHTAGVGVHFMMADGGFSVEGQENIQEILSKQLYLCQCLVALMIVRNGGHFVTKLFDLFTPFSAGLVYLMHRCFDSVSIFKPNTSRPANSERYLICKGKRADTGAIERYLYEINLMLLRNDVNKDVLALVPLELLKSEEDFFNYLKNSNEELGRKQITGLLKIAAYTEDKQKFELKQSEMAKRCLEYWKLPTDKTRVAPRRMQPEDTLKQLVDSSHGFISRYSIDKCHELTEETMNSVFHKLPYNWYFVLCEYGKEDNEDKMPTFYLSLGRTHVYEYKRNRWHHVNNLELPPNTLLYGEMVVEYEKERRMQRNCPMLHVIDAYFLGGENISKEFLPRRHRLIKKFCKALWKPDGSQLIRVRAKDLLALDKYVPGKLQLHRRQMKNGRFECLGYTLPKTSLDDTKNGEPYFFVPKSIMFLKCTANDWNRCFSRKFNMPYFAKGNTSLYEKEMLNKHEHFKASFIDTFNSRVIWRWPENGSLTHEAFLHNIMPCFCDL